MLEETHAIRAHFDMWRKTVVSELLGDSRTDRSTAAHSRPTEWWLHWLLRIALAAEFIGHGAFGVIGKEGWLPYYAVFGIPESIAWSFMPVTGVTDITLGLLVLIQPFRAILAWMAFWGLFTAILRPLAGESVWELIERSYNYGIPFAMLMLHGPGTTVREWFVPIREVPLLTADIGARFARGLRVVVGMLLIGHGALGALTGKALLLDLYDSVGLLALVEDANSLNVVMGSIEIAMGTLVLIRPLKPVLIFVLIWKLATEGLYLTNHSYGAHFEVIERMGAYAAPLALILCISLSRARDERSPEDAMTRTAVLTDGWRRTAKRK